MSETLVSRAVPPARIAVDGGSPLHSLMPCFIVHAAWCPASQFTQPAPSPGGL